MALAILEGVTMMDANNNGTEGRKTMDDYTRRTQDTKRVIDQLVKELEPHGLDVRVLDCSNTTAHINIDRVAVRVQVLGESLRLIGCSPATGCKAREVKNVKTLTTQVLRRVKERKEYQEETERRETERKENEALAEAVTKKAGAVPYSSLSAKESYASTTAEPKVSVRLPVSLDDLSPELAEKILRALHPVFKEAGFNVDVPCEEE